MESNAVLLNEHTINTILFLHHSSLPNTGSIEEYSVSPDIRARVESISTHTFQKDKPVVKTTTTVKFFKVQPT